MRFQYKNWVIDATPDFSPGEFRAHVRVAPGCLNEEPGSCVVDRDDLGEFSREAYAVEQAVNWAIAWIDTNQKKDLR